MGKYSYDLALDNPISVDALILNAIKPNSTVLEFGCANGRMTKYMKQELGCKVYIVEYTKEDYEEAIYYAEDGICEDITDGEWINKFEGIEFDYVLFVDVLEHLRTPNEALKNAGQMLRKNGEVLISVPNIAHNSIIIDLLQNKFQYRQTGLLDNTHVHFFTYNTLLDMLKECGLQPIVKSAIIVYPESTEFANDFTQLNYDCQAIEEKKYGNVYQFVFSSVKKEYYQEHENEIKIVDEIIDTNNKLQSSIYYDLGDGFSEECQIKFSPKHKFENRKVIEEIDIPLGTKRIRIDPVDGKYCILKNLNIYANGVKKAYANINGFTSNSYEVYLTYDPQILVELDGTESKIRIEFERSLYTLDNSILYDLLEGFRVKEYEREQLLDTKNTLIRSLKELKKTLLLTDIELEKQKEEVYEKSQRINEKNQEINQRNQEINQRNQEINQRNQELNQRNQEIAMYEEELRNISTAYDAIQRAFFWRMTKPLRVIVSFLVKIPVIRILLNGCKSIKNFGVKETIRQVFLKNEELNNEESNNKELNNEELNDTELNSEELTNEQPSKTLNFDKNIKFSIVVPLYNTPEKFLREMIESVQNQLYPNWELCLADGSDINHSEVGKICNSFVEKDSRIKYKKLTENLGISENTNKAMMMANGDYIGLLDHDDVLKPNALYKNMQVLDEMSVDVLYSDEDKLDVSGECCRPFYKPDWSPDLLYSQMYICHFLVFKKELFDKVNGYNKKFDGAQDYDLMLRFSEQTDKIYHIPEILYSWRETENSTALNSDSKPYAHTAGLEALDEHLKRKYGDYAKAEETAYTFVYEARFNLLEDKPLVSIIIPMKDQWELSDQCIKSILEKSSYDNYEIIILDNNSVEKGTQEWFDSIIKEDKRIKIYPAHIGFNWSMLNNYGMQCSQGDVFVFLNNDTVVISEDWLEKLSENALRDDIGVVGAQLFYEDGTIQHAGVVLGMCGWAEHVFKGDIPQHIGSPYVSSQVNRNVMAVTGACMAISRKTIEQIGGFDEEFIICGSDVEICIRAYEIGLNNLYDANVCLQHLESKSRDSYIPEQDLGKSENKYYPYRAEGDPYFNVNLTYQKFSPEIISDEEEKMKGFNNHLDRLAITRDEYHPLELSNGSMDINIGECVPINCREALELKDDVRINLLVPSVDSKHVFGGIATALQFYAKLVEKTGCMARVILTDAPYLEESSVLGDEYINRMSDENKTDKYQVVAFNDRAEKTIPVGKNDIFIGTGWWTVYSALPMLKQQKAMFDDNEMKLIYFIQDYEPGFYQWSSRYMMADSTYRLDIPTIAIINSKLLFDFFEINNYKFAYQTYFEPTLNKSLKKYIDLVDTIPKKKQIIVYGRPSVARNAFEILVESLKEWCLIQDDIMEWNIVSAGEKHETIDLGGGKQLKSIGKLSLDEYAMTMLESYAGVSLMVSPHPSYPPLEMAAFGIKTITNVYANKDLNEFSENIYSLESCSKYTIANELKGLCSEYTPIAFSDVSSQYLESDGVMDEIVSEVIEKIGM